jgi:hypothetical protein
VDTVRRRRLRTIGKKGKENAKINREKKAEHIRNGIQTCEVRFKDCTPFDNLTWAHSLKRREMGKWESSERDFNMHESILGCQNCHRVLDEVMGHAEMRAKVKEIIAERPNRMMEAA